MFFYRGSLKELLLGDSSKKRLSEQGQLNPSVEDALETFIQTWEQDQLRHHDSKAVSRAVDELTDMLVDALDTVSKELDVSGTIEYTIPMGTEVQVTTSKGKTHPLKTTTDITFSAKELLRKDSQSLSFRRGGVVITVPATAVG